MITLVVIRQRLSLDQINALIGSYVVIESKDTIILPLEDDALLSMLEGMNIQYKLVEV